jgi:hypothetical protein
MHNYKLLFIIEKTHLVPYLVKKITVEKVTIKKYCKTEIKNLKKNCKNIIAAIRFKQTYILKRKRNAVKSF